MLQLSSTQYQCTEGETEPIIIERRDSGFGDVEVDLHLILNSAQCDVQNSANPAGVDCQPSSPADNFDPNNNIKVISFADGDVTPKVVQFDCLTDNENEASTPESFNLVLSNPRPGNGVQPAVQPVLGNNSSAVFEIFDLNAESSIGFNLAELKLNEDGGTVSITLSREGNNTQFAAADVSFIAGSADANDLAAATTFPIRAQFCVINQATGQCTVGVNGGIIPTTETTITLELNDDLIDEGIEDFQLVLQNPEQASIDAGRASLKVEILDNDNAGTLSFDRNELYVSENQGPFIVPILRQGGGNIEAQVQIRSENGTAVAGADFVAIGTGRTFAANQTLQQISVSINQDDLVEGGESFTLRLLNPTNGAKLGISEMIVHIVDEDSAGEFSFANGLAIDVPEGGVVSIPVLRVGGHSGTATVEFLTSGFATPAADFTVQTASPLSAPNGLVGVLPDQIVLQIAEDGLVEGAETIQVTLSNPTGEPGIGLGEHQSITINIIDKDSPGTVIIEPSSLEVNEDAGTARVLLRRLGGSAGEISVSFETFDGSATVGEDYATVIDTQVFGPGQFLPINVTVPLLDDEIQEDNETFGVRIINATHENGIDVTGTQNQSLITIIDDDALGFLNFDQEASYTVAENVGTASFGIERFNGNQGDINVTCKTVPGDAFADVDYTDTEQAILFADGETLKTCQVPIIDRVDDSGTRFFTIQLIDENGAIIENRQVFIVDVPHNIDGDEALPPPASVSGGGSGCSLQKNAAKSTPSAMVFGFGLMLFVVAPLLRRRLKSAIH